MNSLMMVSMYINGFLYSTKGLKQLRIFSFAGIAATFIGAITSYALHYYSMMLQYGVRIVIIAFIPYIFFSVLIALYQLVKGRRDRTVFSILIGFLPSTVLTEYGITASLFFLMSYIIYRVEKNHRQHVVDLVARFSKRYSPLYQQRFENKKKYKQFQTAYRLLDLVDLSDYELIKERDEKTKNYRTGLPDRILIRTFKIKGLIGTTTVVDDFYIAPQKKRFFL